MNILESSLYELTGLFLAPVLVLILLSLLMHLPYWVALCLKLGNAVRSVIALHWRLINAKLAVQPMIWNCGLFVALNGCALFLGPPMLGLIATMIPMGPALLALGSGDSASVGENLVAAFSAVILALVASSITFFILTVRRRWLLQELRDLERNGTLPINQGK